MLTDTDVKSVIDRKRNFFSTHSNEKHEEKLINVGLLILPIYPSQFIFTYSSENGSRFIFANYDVLLRVTEKLKKGLLIINLFFPFVCDRHSKLFPSWG